MSQIKVGAILSYVSLLITLLITLLYTPILIRFLGQTEYGLYTLIGSVAAYFSIMDMGLGNAIIRFISRNRAVGSKSDESRLNGLFLLLYSVIGIMTVIVGIVLYHKLSYIFGSSLSTLELDKAKKMVVILTVNFALTFPLSVFGSIVQSYEKFSFIKLVAITRSIIVPLISLPFLVMGFKSVTMVTISSAVNISCLLLNVHYCYKYLNIKFYIGKIDFRLLKEILGYSLLVFLGVIVDQINWNTNQFILGIFAGTAPVAIYAIAAQFTNLYKQFSTSISGLYLPKVSIMVANNASTKDLTEIVIKYGRIQYSIMALILSGFALFGQSFISFWAGINYSSAYYIVLIIIIPLTIPLIQNIGISILYAKNIQGFRSVVLILIAIFNIILTIPLTKVYGGIGAAFGTAISLIVGNIIVMNIYYYKKIGINIPLFWWNIIKMSFPIAISILLGIGLNYCFIQYDSLVFLFFKILAYLIIYLSFLWLFALNNYERNLIISTLNTVKGTLSKLMKKRKNTINKV